MRIVSLLLLCFSLAFANVSYAQNHEKNCPIEQDGSMSNMDHANMPDCCNDAETAAKTGKSCKADQDCSISNVVILFLFHHGTSFSLIGVWHERVYRLCLPWRLLTFASANLKLIPFFRSVSSCDLSPCLKHLRCICCNASEFIGSSLCQTYLPEPLCSKVIRHQSGEFTG